MQWVTVTEKLPEKPMPVLCFALNENGKQRIFRAAYARKNELEANEAYCDDWGEYDEKTDTYYAPEGWYEWNDCEETHWRVPYEVTHWMPLPEPPTEGDVMDKPEDWLPDFLEYCEIMKLKPTTRDQMIFMAGMTFQSLKQEHLTTSYRALAPVVDEKRH
jgi:hypothetical protein